MQREPLTRASVEPVCAVGGKVPASAFARGDPIEDLAAIPGQAIRLRRAVAADHDEGTRVEPHPMMCCDALPHLPVERGPDLGAKAAELLEDGASDGHRRELHPALGRDAVEPVVDHAGRLALDPGRPRASPARWELVACKCRADVGLLLDALLHRGVEPGVDPVVVVEDVDPVAPGTVDALVEDLWVAHPAGELWSSTCSTAPGIDSMSAWSLGRCRCVVSIRDDGDLHVGAQPGRARCEAPAPECGAGRRP